jgi:cytidylate kinase
MIITIDGPIATGKSTIAKKLAEKLGFIHFDTGAMYRSLTYALIKNGINYEDPKELEKFFEAYTFDIKVIDGEKHYFVGQEDVTAQIRKPEVTALVSQVAAIGTVRHKLVAIQRAWGDSGVNAVFEGRDIGTVVFPNAQLKIFLTGSTQVRATRRYEELRAKFPEETKELTLEKTIEDINRRDLYDTTREISPLRQAEDAHEVDTSNLSIDQVVDRIISLLPSSSHDNKNVLW